MRHVPLSDLQANAAELTAAMDAGELVCVTLGGREYRLVEEQPTLTPDRRTAMQTVALHRQQLRKRGVRIAQHEVRDWIDQGRP